MEPLTIGLLTAALFVILLVLGMQVAFAAAVAGLLGLWMLKDFGVAADSIGYLTHGLSTRYGLSVIPLFVLMGYLAYYAGLTEDIYIAVRDWVGHFPGGLAIATTFGCAIFGACSGVSVAAAAVFGKIAVPEMDKYGYHRRLSAGVVAASGTLAALIPPSALIIIYAILVEESVGKLLIAGILPGAISAIIYVMMIYTRVRLNPSLGRALPPVSWKKRLTSLRGIVAVPIIFIVVVGGLFIGLFTPTEAGAVGAFSMFVLALVLRRLTWSAFKECLLDAGRTTVMIFLIIVGVLIFMRTLALSGGTIAFIQWTSALPVPRLVILLGFLSLYVVLGMFLTATSMLILTCPLIVPVVVALGYNPIWFGIIAIKMCEICLITPPIGLNVYVLRTVLRDMPVEEIFRGVMPFFFMDVLTVAVLIAFPQITLLLPGLMLGD